MNIKHAFTTSHLTSKDAQDNALLRLPLPFPHFLFLTFHSLCCCFACEFLIKAWIMLNSWFLSSERTLLYSTYVRIDIYVYVYVYIYVKSIATRWPPDVPIVWRAQLQRDSLSRSLCIPWHDFHLIFNFYSLKIKLRVCECLWIFWPSQLVNFQTQKKEKVSDLAGAKSSPGQGYHINW